MMKGKHESKDGIEQLIQNEIRKQALSWWNNMGFIGQRNEWEKWVSITNDPRKAWPLIMVDRSTSCIERIYREIVLEEIF